MTDSGWGSSLGGSSRDCIMHMKRRQTQGKSFLVGVGSMQWQVRGWSKSTGGGPKHMKMWAEAYENVVVTKRMTHPFDLAQN